MGRREGVDWKREGQNNTRTSEKTIQPLKSQKCLVATIVQSKRMLQIHNPALGEQIRGKIRKKSGVSRRVISLIKREVHRNPLQTSKQVFEAVGMFNVPKSTRCSILQRIAKCKKPLVRPPLKQVHREKRLEWAKIKVLKTELWVRIIHGWVPSNSRWTRWLETRMVWYKSVMSTAYQAWTRKWWSYVLGRNHPWWARWPFPSEGQWQPQRT